VDFADVGDALDNLLQLVIGDGMEVPPNAFSIEQMCERNQLVSPDALRHKMLAEVKAGKVKVKRAKGPSDARPRNYYYAVK